MSDLKEDTMSLALFDISAYEDKRFENPMVTKVGLGPDGETCKRCVHLKRMGSESRPWETRYCKCEERRGMTHGEGTGHKASYHAGALFE